MNMISSSQSLNMMDYMVLQMNGLNLNSLADNILLTLMVMFPIKPL